MYTGLYYNEEDNGDIWFYIVESSEDIYRYGCKRLQNNTGWDSPMTKDIVVDAKTIKYDGKEYKLLEKFK